MVGSSHKAIFIRSSVLSTPRSTHRQERVRYQAWVDLGGKESDYLAVHPERSIGNCYPWLRGGWSGPKLKQTNKQTNLNNYFKVRVKVLWKSARVYQQLIPLFEQWCLCWYKRLQCHCFKFKLYFYGSWFSGVFSSFNGQHSVVEAWTHPSPWSI